MNKFTRKGKTAESRREQHPRPQGQPWAYRLLAFGLVTCGMIFGAIAIRVHLNEKIDQLEREREAIIYEQRSIEKLCKNLQAQKEEKTSLAFVQKKIKEYNLNLRPTAQTQICHLKKYDSVTPAADGQMVAGKKAKSGDARTASLK